MSALGVPSPASPFDDIETAEALLGLLILYPVFADAAECVSAADFLAPHHAIFAAIGVLTEEAALISPLTVKARVGGILDELGGVAYLANLVAAAPAVGRDAGAHAAALAMIVRDSARRRRMAIELAAAQETLKDRSVPLSRAVHGVVCAFDDLALGLARHSSTAHAGLAMAEALERGSKGHPPPSIAMGIPTLDRDMGGFFGGEFVIVAGRPGMGKSMSLFATLYRAALSGAPAIGFSIEMRREALLQRMACDIDYDRHPNEPSLLYMRCRTPERLGQREIERFAEAMIDLPESLHIYDGGGMTMANISAISRKHAAQSDRMGVVVIDYLQKIQPSDRYRGQRVQEVTEIVGQCQTLAKSLGWPVIAGCQLNRGVEGRSDRFPTLSDLRETGAIEQDADIVLGLYRESYYVRQKMRGLGEGDTGYAKLEGEYRQCRNRLDISLLKFRQGADETYEVFCDIGASAIRRKEHRRGDVE